MQTARGINVSTSMVSHPATVNRLRRPPTKAQRCVLKEATKRCSNLKHRETGAKRRIFNLSPQLETDCEERSQAFLFFFRKERQKSVRKNTTQTCNLARRWSLRTSLNDGIGPSPPPFDSAPTVMRQPLAQQCKRALWTTPEFQIL